MVWSQVGDAIRVELRAEAEAIAKSGAVVLGEMAALHRLQHTTDKATRLRLRPARLN